MTFISLLGALSSPPAASYHRRKNLAAGTFVGASITNCRRGLGTFPIEILGRLCPALFGPRTHQSTAFLQGQPLAPASCARPQIASGQNIGWCGSTFASFRASLGSVLGGSRQIHLGNPLRGQAPPGVPLQIGT